MTVQDENLAEISKHWYCVRSKPKHERLASRCLRMIPGIEVFCPQIRYKKATARGPVWFNEAVFPGYIFVKFNLESKIRQICTTFGVQGMVRFGEKHAVVNDGIVDVLRKQLDGNDIKSFAAPVSVGEHATVLEGPFAGLEVVVSRVMPARERVGVLMDILGRVTEAEVKLSSLATKPVNPLAA